MDESKFLRSLVSAVIDTIMAVVESNELDLASTSVAEALEAVIETPIAISPSSSAKGDEPTANLEPITEAKSEAGASNTGSCAESYPADSIYHVKWIDFNETRMPVVLQSENGPCPLLAVINVLLLRGQVALADDAAVVTGHQLMALLGDSILRLTPERLVGEQNYEQNVSDAMGVIDKLATGLDVNVRFNGIASFEYTPECIVFDLLGIPLYHGWLADPQLVEVGAALGALSYNQLVERIITDRHSADTHAAAAAVTAESFLEATASQLTYHGLCELNERLRDHELAVFFRNNHFSVLLKHRDEVFLLVTDQGFLHEPRVVWETLNNVDGDSHFVDAAFHTVPPAVDAGRSGDQSEQIEQDYLMALSLEQEVTEESASARTPTPADSPPQQSAVLSDEQLARRLQDDETAAAARERLPQSTPTQPQPVGGGPGQQRRDSSSKCKIL